MTAPGSFLSSISLLNALVRRARRAADMPAASGAVTARAPFVVVDVLCCAPARIGQTSVAIAAMSSSFDRGPGVEIMICLPRRGLRLEHSHGLAGEPRVHVLQRLTVEDPVSLLGDVAEMRRDDRVGEVAQGMVER